jgi:hypothetical protein
MSTRIAVVPTKFGNNDQIEKLVNDKIIQLEKSGAKKESIKTYAIKEAIVIEYKLGASKIAKMSISDNISDFKNEKIRDMLINMGVLNWATFARMSIDYTINLMSRFTITERRLIAEILNTKGFQFVAEYNVFTNSCKQGNKK